MPYFGQMRVFRPLLTSGLATRVVSLVDEAMVPDVLGTDASREVPFLTTPAVDEQAHGNRSNLDANDGSQVEPMAEQETEIESGDSRILYEDVSAQITAAKEFTTLVAAQILDAADSILDVAAHLGPQRVLMLLA
jgi:hypothetical protein